jgi:20S proteasome alpha/beta subunit
MFKLPPKPHPYLRPKFKRLPRRTAMTIAAGFYCNEGVVLCADTQETISGYIKTYDGKVSTHVYKNLALCIAGAGSSDYIKTAISKLTHNFPNCKNYADVTTAMEERLLSFFDQNLARWAYHPEQERPTVELLIGLSGVNMGHHLFHYIGTSFSRTDSRAIGSGVLLANALINRFSFGNYSLSELTSLGIYILSKVKEGVDGCGGHTHIMALRKNRDFAFTEDSDIEKLEQEFSEIEKRTDKIFAQEVMSKSLPLSWHNEHVANKKKKLSADKEQGSE